MARSDQAGGTSAREATDRLALALEEVGFDVGLDFPALNEATDRNGSPVVRIGDVRPEVADRLAALVRGAAVTINPTEEDDNR